MDRAEAIPKLAPVGAGQAIFAIAAVVVFVLDRVTKAVVASSIPLGSEQPAIDHVVWITHIQNSGAAFGLAPFGSVFFLVVSIVVAVGLVAYVLTQQVTVSTAGLLGLVLGGTVGNGYDRLLHGSVTDFVTLHWWPVFNVADSAISVGVALLVLSSLFRRKPA